MSSNGTNGHITSTPIAPSLLLAGRPKSGKTSAVVAALGTSAFWVTTEQGALAPATNKSINPSGQVPDHIDCLGMAAPCAEALAALRVGLAGVREGKYGTVVIDTLSSLADREYHKITAVEREVVNYGRAARRLVERIQPIMWEALASGATVIALCHDKEPETWDDGKISPGGLRLPGKLVELEPSLFRTVLRVDFATGASGASERIVRCDPTDKRYFQGDSWGVVVDGEPLDLKSILRRIMQRARGLTEDAAPTSLLGGRGAGASAGVTL